ncbi:MAG: DUF2723 domain-containing protein [Bacteroidetes bacterium]|nr:DUF2723 domain-containing protein [Bacteroidota bacterium]
MENIYKKYNNLFGWLVFAIAAFTYCSTVEDTASFWDCGEFIASAFKLEVGHPPGAPLWMMVARAFALLAGDDVMMVAYWVNIFSALCTAFAILFLFWTITALAKKVALQSGELTSAKMIGIIASGFIGAVAYTFTDTIWFSAVEGEVYASSMFFTAIVFWLILKWDAIADEKYADRYLVLIAYLMGLSIGVHLLNLLTIPALVYVYYFRKNKVITPMGFVKAGAIGVLILGLVQYGVIQSLVKIGTFFELKFVNSFGLPYNSGVIFFALLIIGAIVAGVLYARKKKYYLMHTLVMSFAVILIGYSTFLVIVIRSNANTPMDENNPENAFSLLPYLNREQYGDRPLLYGQTFNSVADREQRYLDEDPTYYKRDDKTTTKYLVSDDGKDKTYNYNPKTMKVLPRMYSSEDRHRNAYENWLGFKGGKRGKKVTLGEGEGGVIYIPTHFDDMEFFARYQFNFMYWRYFMWNFAGRQNDLQASDLQEVMYGNWISGFEMIDKERIGDEKVQPAILKENKGRNYYYFLPLILGLIGLIFHFTKSVKDGFVVLLLFFMTGIGIIIYLNQPPYQPRERDYAYVGSFYTFAIWIGLGVQALIFFMSSFKKQAGLSLIQKLEQIGAKEVVYTGAALIGLGLVAYLKEYKGVGYSLMFVGAAMAVVPILCHYLGQMIENEKGKAFLALIATIGIPYMLAAKNWDDHDRSGRTSARDIAKCYLESCAPNAILFTNGDNDTFPLWYVQEVEGFRTDVRVVNLSLLNTDWFINQMKRKAYDSDPVPFSLTEDAYRERNRNVVLVIDPTNENMSGHLASFTPEPLMAKWKQMWKDGEDIDQIMKILSADDSVKVLKFPNIFGATKPIEFITTNKVRIKVDSATVVANGTVTKEMMGRIPKEIVFNLGSVGNGYDVIYKNKLMVLDLLATNDWKRPIYFSSTVGTENFFGLQNYFRKEGLAYRLTPINYGGSQRDFGYTDSKILYDNVMNKFHLENFKDTTIYIDEQNGNLSNNYRMLMEGLAEQLIMEGKKDSAVKVLDKIVDIMPNKNFPYDDYMIGVANSYFLVGQKEKGMQIFNILKKNFIEEYAYITFFPIKYQHSKFGNYPYEHRMQYTQQKLAQLLRVATDNKLDDKIIKELEAKLR